MTAAKLKNRDKANTEVAADMIRKKDTLVMTMFRVPEVTDAKFRLYCSNIVNTIDEQIINEGYSLVERRGKRSDGKSATFAALMEVLAANRENLTDDDQKIVDHFEEILVDIMKKYRKERDFVKS